VIAVPRQSHGGSRTLIARLQFECLTLKVRNEFSFSRKFRFIGYASNVYITSSISRLECADPHNKV